ncbi:MAG TPA: hypothetical protein VFU08_09615 [Candidatus Udaeobacter sp.]|jgi:hypothetical protein|nr:hypothetical protein [Candidatus Udaeobacter sp.]
MKVNRNLSITALLAAAFCLSLGMSVAKADDNEQGGEIEGTEDLHIEMQMTPTGAAPPGSSIELQLEVDNEDGTTQAELELDENGLPAGTFTVSVTLKSNGSTVQLGTFTIANGQTEAEIKFSNEDENENDNEDENENENDEDEIELPFPANVNPFDIATVSVSNSGGVVLFTTDLTNVMTMSATLNASITGQPGPSDPGASGSAVLTATASHSRPNGSLHITGQGLPPNTPLKVTINGKASNRKKARTMSMGTVNIMITPRGKTRTVARGVTLLQVKKVTLTNNSGNVLLNFSF